MENFNDFMMSILNSAAWKLIILILVPILIIKFIEYIVDKYKFNNGKCRLCNHKLDRCLSFKLDHRKYVCPQCGHSLYIKNTLVDKEWSDKID